MPYKLNDKEYNSIIGLPSGKRYEHFLKRIADWQEVWTLRNSDGYVLLGDNDGNEAIPVWPHPEYAKIYQKDDWADTIPECIDLDNWINKWLSGMQNDKRFVAAFPVGDKGTAFVEPSKHLDHLRAELEKYEE